MSLYSRRLRAFTLVELLTVMAVISTLMTILLPAVNHVREIGRRTVCASNMRQLALACNTYHSIHNAFPCGQVGCPDTIQGGVGTFAPLYYLPAHRCVGPNWLALIMVHLDESGLAGKLNGCATSPNVYKSCDLAGNAPPSYLICPSAPEMSADKAFQLPGGKDIQKGNYAGCWGMEGYYNKAMEAGGVRPTSDPEHLNTGLYAAQMDGVFGYVPILPMLNANRQPTVINGLFKLGHGKGTRIDYMTDGVSKTIMISEVIGYDSTSDSRGAWFFGGMGASAFTAKLPPNSAWSPDNQTVDINGRAVQLKDSIQFADGSIPRNDRYNSALSAFTSSNPAAEYAGARSGHPGGVNVAMADSSTRFVSESIGPNIWKAASSRSGKADTEADFYMPPPF